MSEEKKISVIEAWLSACYQMAIKPKYIPFRTGRKSAEPVVENFAPLINFIRALYYADNESARLMAEDQIVQKPGSDVRYIKQNDVMLARLKLETSADGREWNDVENIDAARPPEQVAVRYEDADFRLRIDPALILNDCEAVRELDSKIIARLDAYYTNKDPYFASYLDEKITAQDKGPMMVRRAKEAQDGSYQRIMSWRQKTFARSQEERADDFFARLKSDFEDRKAIFDRLTRRVPEGQGSTENSASDPLTQKKIKTIRLNIKPTLEETEEKARRQAEEKEQSAEPHSNHRIQLLIEQNTTWHRQDLKKSHKPPGPERLGPRGPRM